MKNKTVFAKCLMLAVLMSLLMSLTLPVTTMADSRVVRETDYSDKFRVTIYWTVDNNHKDQGNYIKLYYYKPVRVVRLV